MMPTPQKTKLVRDALTKSTRKELQGAAKALGIKANGTNASMVESLNNWLAQSESAAAAPPAAATSPPTAVAAPAIAADLAPRSPARSMASSDGAPATPASLDSRAASLGISGLKSERRDSLVEVGDLANALDATRIDENRKSLSPIHPRSVFGDASNVLDALPTNRDDAVVKPMIKAQGPATNWTGTHVRF